LTQVGKIKPSDVDLWLSRYRFGSASRNLHISCVRELFNSAVRDRIITVSPAAHLRSAKREKPIRLTPTFEQFRAIIADVRAQVFNADAQNSADLLEFLGLAGLGQAEAGSLTPTGVDLASGQIITYRHKRTRALQFRSFRKCGHYWKDCAKGKRMMHECSTFAMPKRRWPEPVGV